MQVHWLVALCACTVLHEAGAPTFDLDTTSGLLLDVLHIRSAMAHDLGSEVEARHWFHVDRYALFRPFALNTSVSRLPQGWEVNSAYTSEFISFKLVWLAATKSAFIDEIWQLLLHELFNLFNSFLKTGLCGAGDVKVERWILQDAVRKHN